MLTLAETFDASSLASWGEWFVKLSVLFLLGGLCGWVIEFFYRRIAGGKWINPGFLEGPMLPIYGFGNVCMYILCSLPYDWVGPEWAQKLVCAVFIAVLMTLIEFIAGLIFIKGMKIKLWDYSRNWGNIMGIICPLFSLIWAACGTGYLFLLYDPFVNMLNYFVSNLVPWLFFLGMGYGFLIVDLCYSFHVVAKVKTYVSDKNLVVEWEKMKASFQDFQKTSKVKLQHIFPFAGEGVQFKAQMEAYVAELKVRLDDLRLSKEKKKSKKEEKKEDQ